MKKVCIFLLCLVTPSVFAGTPDSLELKKISTAMNQVKDSATMALMLAPIGGVKQYYDVKAMLEKNHINSFPPIKVRGNYLEFTVNHLVYRFAISDPSRGIVVFKGIEIDLHPRLPFAERLAKALDAFRDESASLFGLILPSAYAKGTADPELENVTMAILALGAADSAVLFRTLLSRQRQLEKYAEICSSHDLPNSNGSLQQARIEGFTSLVNRLNAVSGQYCAVANMFSTIVLDAPASKDRKEMYAELQRESFLGPFFDTCKQFQHIAACLKNVVKNKSDFAEADAFVDNVLAQTKPLLTDSGEAISLEKLKDTAQ